MIFVRACALDHVMSILRVSWAMSSNNSEPASECLLGPPVSASSPSIRPALQALQCPSPSQRLPGGAGRLGALRRTHNLTREALARRASECVSAPDDSISVSSAPPAASAPDDPPQRVQRPSAIRPSRPSRPSSRSAPHPHRAGEAVHLPSPPGVGVSSLSSLLPSPMGRPRSQAHQAVSVRARHAGGPSTPSGRRRLPLFRPKETARPNGVAGHRRR